LFAETRLRISFTTSTRPFPGGSYEAAVSIGDEALGLTTSSP